MKYLVLTAFLFLSVKAQAYCGVCEAHYGLRESFERADIVFVGQKMANASFIQTKKPKTIMLQVNEVFYGDYNKQYIQVQSYEEGCYRGLNTPLNQKHLFVLEKTEEGWRAVANGCGYDHLAYTPTGHIVYKKVPHTREQILEILEIATNKDHPLYQAERLSGDKK